MSVFMFLNRDHFISVEFVLFVYLLVYLSFITQGRDFLVAVRLSFVAGGLRPTRGLSVLKKMAASKQSNAITLKGSTEMVAEFFGNVQL